MQSGDGRSRHLQKAGMENELINPEPDNTAMSALKAAVEALIYVAEEPVTLEQIVSALGTTADEAGRDAIRQAIQSIQQECRREDRGLEVREIAGGYKMFTKPEHHEAIRKFVKDLTPPLKLSMAALETLATIAYRQPVTVPEIQQIRGVNATGVLKTLLEKKLITTAGRKNVIGRPILYKTTKEFLVKFGLSGLEELPTLEEFGELARAALAGSLTENGPETSPEEPLESPQLEWPDDPVATSATEDGQLDSARNGPTQDRTSSRIPADEESNGS